MHKFGLSVKTVHRIHTNRADINEIKRWQHNTKSRISRLESKGFVTIVFNESIFVNDPAGGTKYWSSTSTRNVTTYKGRHDKIVATVLLPLMQSMYQAEEMI